MQNSSEVFKLNFDYYQLVVHIKVVFEILPHLYFRQTCSASHKVKSSQSHDFDFFQNPKKVKVMTLTFFKNPKKSQSPDFDFDLTF
jgi:hypothetical protein